MHSAWKQLVNDDDRPLFGCEKGRAKRWTTTTTTQKNSLDVTPSTSLEWRKSVNRAAIDAVYSVSIELQRGIHSPIHSVSIRLSTSFRKTTTQNCFAFTIWRKWQERLDKHSLCFQRSKIRENEKETEKTWAEQFAWKQRSNDSDKERRRERERKRPPVQSWSMTQCVCMPLRIYRSPIHSPRVELSGGCLSLSFSALRSCKLQYFG